MCVLPSPYISAQSTAGYLRGKSGAQLKEAVRIAERPQHLSSTDEIWDAFRHIDSADSTAIIDRYSDKTYPIASSGPAYGMTIDHVLPPAWWKGSTPNYADTISQDMHQLSPCNAGVPAQKNDYPPGEVTTPTFDNGTWQVGYGTLAGEKIWVYTPAVNSRGDFARAVFYMVTLYPVKMWNGLGVNLLADNSYPTLNAYARRVLLQWHAADPVDNAETTRNNYIARTQGNSNLFVTYPDLAQHIWGEKSNQPWEPPTDPQQPDRPVPQPLRGTYLTGDTIHLYSPYIPDTAQWMINGQSVSDKTIKAASIGKGEHEIRFTGAGTHGKLKIRVL